MHFKFQLTPREQVGVWGQSAGSLTPPIAGRGERQAQWESGHGVGGGAAGPVPVGTGFGIDTAIEKGSMTPSPFSGNSNRCDRRFSRRQAKPDQRGHLTDLGCWSGAGVVILFERFSALAVVEQIGSCSVERDLLKAKDECCHAVFAFNVLYRVVDWPLAIEQIARVLRPGGTYFFEELASARRDPWTCRPHSEARHGALSESLFSAELERNGMSLSRAATPRRSSSASFHGVAIKQSGAADDASSELNE